MKKEIMLKIGCYEKIVGPFNPEYFSATEWLFIEKLLKEQEYPIFTLRCSTSEDEKK